MTVPEKKHRVKTSRRQKTRRSSESESDDVSPVKQIKTEDVTSQLVSCIRYTQEPVTPNIIQNAP